MKYSVKASPQVSAAGVLVGEDGGGLRQGHYLIPSS